LQAIENRADGVGVGFHEGFGTLQGVADAGIAARTDGQRQQDGRHRK